MKFLIIRYIIWFVLLFGVGLWSYFLTRQWRQMIIGMTVYFTIVVVVAGWTWYNYRIFKFSPSVERIDRYLRRRKKRIFPGYIYAMTHGDYEVARKLAVKRRNADRRAQYLAGVASAEEKWNEAAEWISQIRNPAVKPYFLALKTLRERNWNAFFEAKAAVKDKVSLLVLDVEEAYARGDIQMAEKLGQQAIDSAKGVQKYVLVKELELSEHNPNRTSYF